MSDVDILDEKGIRVKDYSTISEELKSNFKSIYGRELNLESNTPDGQMIGLFAQSGADIREVIKNAWNDLFADTAQGKALDRLYSILGVARKSGSKARVHITVTTNRAIAALEGLDGKENPNAFTISDGSGNDFHLESSRPLEEGENANVVFVAKNTGYTQIKADTITNISSSQDGVINVTNPSAPFEPGTDFESDTQYRSRARLGNSSNRNKGSKELIEAAVLEVEGVEECVITEGNDGSIRVVVKGAGDIDGINDAIYRTKPAGIRTEGTEKTKDNKEMNFYPAKQESLQYKLTVKDKDDIESRVVDKETIEKLILNKKFNINQEVNQLQIAEIIYNNFRNLVITKSFVRRYDSENNKCYCTNEDDKCECWQEYVEPADDGYFILDKVFLENAYK